MKRFLENIPHKLTVWLVSLFLLATPFSASSAHINSQRWLPKTEVTSQVKTPSADLYFLLDPIPALLPFDNKSELFLSILHSLKGAIIYKTSKHHFLPLWEKLGMNHHANSSESNDHVPFPG